MTKAGLQKKYQISPTTVANWLAKGCPHTKTSAGHLRFDPRAVAQWRRETLTPRPSVPVSLNEAKRRKETALAELRELELRKRQGELVEVSAIERQAFETGRQVRDALLSLPERLSGIFAAEPQQDKIFDLFTKELQLVLSTLTQEERGHVQPKS